MTNTPFQLTASFLKSLKISSYETSGHGHSRSVNFHIPRVCNFDFIMKVNLRIYKGYDHENCLGCNFTPSVIIHGQIPYHIDFRKIEIANTKIMKICSWTKI